MASITTTVSTADVAIKASGGRVHWITASNIHATATTAIELNDSGDDSGTDRWAITLDAVDGATGAIHAIFEPAIQFDGGIWLDITGGTVVVTVGYA